MQAALPVIGATLVGGLFGGAMQLLSKKPKPPPSPGMPDRGAAAALAADSDFRRRQGAGANILTSPGGVEAPSPGAKALLGQ
jgi:hypothetical protein